MAPTKMTSWTMGPIVMSIILGASTLVSSTIAIMEKSRFGEYKTTIAEIARREQSLQIRYEGDIRSLTQNVDALKEIAVANSSKIADIRDRITRIEAAVK